MELLAPFTGTVVAIPATADQHVTAGEPVVVIEAMKMEHEILAEQDGVVARVAVQIGETVTEGQPLVVVEPGAAPSPADAVVDQPGQAPEREDLHTVHERHDIGLDHRRPEAVARRHEQGRRTARENLTELLDADTFVEYGPLMFAAQEQRRSRQELIERTPADGLVGGIGAVEGDPVAALD